MDREALLAAIAGDCAGSLDRKGSKIKAPVVLVAARTGLAAIRVSDPRPLAANALSRGLAETRGKPHEVNLILDGIQLGHRDHVDFHIRDLGVADLLLGEHRDGEG